MKFGVATNSVDKINGIKLAISRHFQIDIAEIEIVHHAVESNVAEQPFGDATYQGAWNRANNLMKIVEDADFYVGCEAGIDVFLDMYFSVQVVCIYDKQAQRYMFGKSAGWQIPEKDVKVVKDSNLDYYMRSKGLNCLEDLLGEGQSRANAVAQATECALATIKLY